MDYKTEQTYSLKITEVQKEAKQQKMFLRSDLCPENVVFYSSILCMVFLCKFMSFLVFFIQFKINLINKKGFQMPTGKS